MVKFKEYLGGLRGQGLSKAKLQIETNIQKTLELQGAFDMKGQTMTLFENFKA